MPNRWVPPLVGALVGLLIGYVMVLLLLHGSVTVTENGHPCSHPTATTWVCP
jgi:hypothetical protein